MRPIGSAAELEARRRRGIELLKQGYSVTHVANILGCGHSAVSKWRKAYEKGGDQAVRAVPHPGRKRKLSDDELKRLVEYLKAGPKAAGYETDLWTCRRVAKLILDKFGVEYRHCHVWKILTDYLGWTAQKPEVVARERDERAIQEWKTRDWPRIKKSAAA